MQFGAPAQKTQKEEVPLLRFSAMVLLPFIALRFWATLSALVQYPH